MQTIQAGTFAKLRARCSAPSSMRSSTPSLPAGRLAKNGAIPASTFSPTGSLMAGIVDDEEFPALAVARARSPCRGVYQFLDRLPGDRFIPEVNASPCRFSIAFDRIHVGFSRSCLFADTSRTGLARQAQNRSPVGLAGHDALPLACLPVHRRGENLWLLALSKPPTIIAKPLRPGDSKHGRNCICR